jgi:hypothetical protein
MLLIGVADFNYFDRILIQARLCIIRVLASTVPVLMYKLNDSFSLKASSAVIWLIVYREPMDYMYSLDIVYFFN